MRKQSINAAKEITLKTIEQLTEPQVFDKVVNYIADHNTGDPEKNEVILLETFQALKQYKEFISKTITSK